MASPRALRFCWAPSGADPPTAALRDFQPRVWNGLCLGSALLSLLGVLLLRALRRRRHERGRRGSCRASDGRLATARALRTAAIASSCLGAAGILARSVLWLAVPSGTASPLCVVVLTWVQYGFASHFWALFCYSLEAFLLLRNPTGHRSVAPYYLLCWGVSGATHCLPGLLLLLSFSADDEHCSSSPMLAQALDVLPFAATYVPLTLVLLGSPVLFSRALQAVPALLRRGMGMYTASERCQEQQLRKKFIGIVMAFTACWMANVANETLLLLLEWEPSWRQGTWRWLRGATLTCWTIMAVLNPLSGFLLMLGFSAWRSNTCARRTMPAWRTCSEIVGSSSRNCSPLPETTSDPALGFLGGPGVLEVSSLLASLDTSNSMDFTCAVSENSSIQPLHRCVRVSQEEMSPGRGSCNGRFLGWSYSRG